MARVARIEQTGGPEVIRWIDVDLADPGPGEVRLRTTAVGLNYIDTYFRSGLYPSQLPAGIGSEATGVIEVGALPGLLGNDLAAGFSEHSGKTVTFEAQSPDDFLRAIIPLFGEASATPVVDSYRWRATQPEELISSETSAQSLLNLQPRSVASWLKDISA